MKKNLFIILISTLLILILLYFYEERESILNKEYLDTKNHIHVEYPFFHDPEIDDYLEEYLQTYIQEKKNMDDFLFIDYDYFEMDSEGIQLTMYVYEENGVVIQKSQKSFSIDLYRGEIVEDRDVENVSLDYDGYSQALIDKDKPMVALTFDDGPNHNTGQVLNILERFGVKATFFVLGCNIEGNEEMIEKMDELGMEIGNHMYSHKLLTRLKEEEIQTEVKKVDDLVFDITSKYPILIRPSYGTYNKKIQSVMDRPIVIWNIDTLDWKSHNSKKIFNRVMKSLSDGDIILMHDIYNATANSLELLIPKLLDMGYQMVTVSELLYYKGIDAKEGGVYSHAN